MRQRTLIRRTLTMAVVRGVYALLFLSLVLSGCNDTTPVAPGPPIPGSIPHWEKPANQPDRVTPIPFEVRGDLISTSIRFSIPVDGTVTMRLFDGSDAVVATILNQEFLEAGVHQVDLAVSNISVGGYVFTLLFTPYSDSNIFTPPTLQASLKMLLIK